MLKIYGNLLGETVAIPHDGETEQSALFPLYEVNII